MDKGIYAASSGGLINARRLDVVANNLANVQTVGFKAERLIAREQAFSDTLASKITTSTARDQLGLEDVPGAVHTGSYTDFSQGPIAANGDPLNVALTESNTFFVVATPNGDAYTRAGNFTLNRDRVLVTADGLPVQGDGGPITLPTGGQGKISSSGVVTVDGAVVGRLRTVKIEDTSTLKRQEGVRFTAAAAQVEVVPAELVPESVEMPNVNVVEAMVDMINAQRGFEAYTKSVRTIDELNERALRNARMS